MEGKHGKLLGYLTKFLELSYFLEDWNKEEEDPVFFCFPFISAPFIFVLLWNLVSLLVSALCGGWLPTVSIWLSGTLSWQYLNFSSSLLRGWWKKAVWILPAPLSILLHRPLLLEEDVLFYLTHGLIVVLTEVIRDALLILYFSGEMSMIY